MFRHTGSDGPQSDEEEQPDDDQCPNRRLDRSEVARGMLQIEVGEVGQGKQTTIRAVGKIWLSRSGAEFEAERSSDVVIAIVAAVVAVRSNRCR